jgi:hypothetical protein
MTNCVLGAVCKGGPPRAISNDFINPHNPDAVVEHAFFCVRWCAPMAHPLCELHAHRTLKAEYIFDIIGFWTVFFLVHRLRLP